MTLDAMRFRTMRYRRLISITLVCAGILSFSRLHHRALAAEAPVISNAPVTWSRQIASIVYQNCTTCHHPGGGGPFSLLTYQDARRRGPQMVQVTQSRYMPPWLPAPGYGDFADPRRLSDGQVALIRRWVEAGMPEGDSAEAPPQPR